MYVLSCPALRFCVLICYFLLSYKDPDDPTTFPGYQGGPLSQVIPSQVPVSSDIGTRNTLANAQTSLPQAGAGGYHGHPTV
jgi:hypothetical protein